MSVTAYVTNRPTLKKDLIPDSPLWWLVQMELRLVQRQQKMLRMDRYYRGEHPLPFLTPAHESKIRTQFNRLLEESRPNFMRLVVDATEERISVDGFRLSAENDAVADKESWDLWQANQMDAQSQTAFLESLVKGVSYLGVWSDDDKDGYADICVEDPLQTIVFYEPGSNYRRRAAALKIWLDDVTGMRRANVYLPEAIYRFQAPAWTGTMVPTVEQQVQIPWSPMEIDRVRNTIGIVPIIPLRNRPRLLVEGESELEDVVRIQDQINAFVFLMALAGYMGAHRQRWVTGLSLVSDKDGKPIEPFKTAIDTLWQTENPNTNFGEFSQTDLSNYISAIEQKVLHIAVTTRTPRHYLIQSGQSPSGDAIQSAESGLVKKVIRKQRTWGEGLEEAMRLARLFQGNTDAPVDSEIVWADPQSHTPGVITDAVMKQYLGRLIPHAMALEQLGYSQTQIRQVLAAPDGDFAPSPLDSLVDKSAQTTDITRNTPHGE